MTFCSHKMQMSVTTPSAHLQQTTVTSNAPEHRELCDNKDKQTAEISMSKNTSRKPTGCMHVSVHDGHSCIHAGLSYLLPCCLCNPHPAVHM